MQIKDIDGQRTVELASTPKLPGSIFLTYQDVCVEFDRGIFVHAIGKEFGLADRAEEIMT